MGAVRRPPGHLRRLHGERARPRVHRGPDPRRGAAALREHAHRVVRHRPADEPPARGRAADRPRRRRRHRRDVRHLLRLRRDRRGRQADRHPRPADPVGARRPLRAVRATSRRRSGPWSSSAPSSTTRTSCPWRESIADVVVIPEDGDGHVDLAALEAELARARRRGRLKIGSFSAASNVTGILSNTCAIADLLHRHGALSFWDFAAAAPYVEIEMHPTCSEHPLAHKDAVFLSPHKLVGGPGTPGVLVVRRELLTNRVPDVVGGGTVAYVGADRAPLPRRPDHARGGRHPGHRRGDPGRARLPAQGGRRRRRDQRARGGLLAARRRALDAEREHPHPRQPRGRPALDRVVRRPRAVRAAISTTTTSSPCSTTSSGSSPAAAARAPAPTATGCSASASSARSSTGRS